MLYVLPEEEPMMLWNAQQDRNFINSILICQYTKIVILFILVISFIDLHQKHEFCHTISRSRVEKSTSILTHLSYAGYVLRHIFFQFHNKKNSSLLEHYNIIYVAERANQLRKTLSFTEDGDLGK